MRDVADRTLDDVLEVLQEQNQLLRELLNEHRRRRFTPVKIIEKKWLNVAESAEYTGMSDTWIRDLKPVAPPGLFSKVKGTLFLNWEVLDRVLAGNLKLR